MNDYYWRRVSIWIVTAAARVWAELLIPVHLINIPNYSKWEATESGADWPIRGQYPGHMITLDQSEANICERGYLDIWDCPTQSDWPKPSPGFSLLIT